MYKFYKFIISFVFIATVIIGGHSPSLADDYTKGVEAYQKGDFTTALKFWQPLAEQGYAQAQSNLGFMYAKGKGVPQDHKTAVKWYTLAAEQGNAKAQSNLGVKYDKGEGVPQDDKTAVKWYTLAAEQGDAKAQSNLGIQYSLGEGVPQDYIKAYMWLNIAAANGNEPGTKGRDLVKKKMTPNQIEKAQGYSTKCVKQNYKNCDF